MADLLLVAHVSRLPPKYTKTAGPGPLRWKNPLANLHPSGQSDPTHIDRILVKVNRISHMTSFDLQGVLISTLVHVDFD